MTDVTIVLSDFDQSGFIPDISDCIEDSWGVTVLNCNEKISHGPSVAHICRQDKAYLVKFGKDLDNTKITAFSSLMVKNNDKMFDGSEK